MKKFLLTAFVLFTVSKVFSMDNYTVIEQGLNAIELNVYNQIVEQIKNNNLIKLERIFSSENLDLKKIINHFSEEGLAPLHYALLVKKANSEIIALLLKKGADPNLAVQKLIHWQQERTLHLYAGWTALHIAVQTYANKNVLKQLADKGANFWQADTERWRPIDLVFNAQSIPAAQFIFKTMKDEIFEKNFLRTKEHDHYINFLRSKLGLKNLAYRASGDHFMLKEKKRRKRKN